MTEKQIRRNQQGEVYVIGNSMFGYHLGLADSWGTICGDGAPIGETVIGTFVAPDQVGCLKCAELLKEQTQP